MAEPIGTVGKLAGLCVHTGVEWVKVKGDATQRLWINIASQSNPVEVSVDGAADMPVAQHQFDGMSWHKSNMLFGYNAIWDENLGGITGLTYYEANSDTIPSGELWILQAVSAQNYSEASNNVQLSITRASGATVFLAAVTSLDQYVPLLVTGTFVLRAGDLVQLYMDGLSVGNTIKAGIVGYKMDLEM